MNKLYFISVHHLFILSVITSFIPDGIEGYPYGAMELRLQEQRYNGTATETKPQTAAVEAQPRVAEPSGNTTATKTVIK